MKVLVPVKRVVDAYVTPRVKADGSGVETDNVKMSLNPFCEIALEEALRLRERGVASGVLVVSVGEAKSEDVLRTALALGADRAVRIDAPRQTEPLTLAKLLKGLVEKEGIGLALLGKQAIDGDNNQTGQMLAALLGWGQATSVSKLEIKDGKALATREIDSGLQMRAMSLPAVLTVDLRLNEPRYASLPNIMKARKIPIELLSPSSLGVEIAERVRTLSVVEPARRESGTLVANASELKAKLQQAKVL